MSKRSKHNRKQIQLLSAGAFLVTGLLLVLTSYLLFQQQLQNTTHQLGQLLVRQLAHTSTRAVIQQDKLAMQVLLATLVEHDNVAYTAILDPEGKPLAEAFSDEEKVPDSTWVTTHSSIIALHDSIAGKALLTIDLTRQAREINQLSTIMTLVVCLMALFLWLGLPRFIDQIANKKTVIITRTEESPPDTDEEISLPVYNTPQIDESSQPESPVAEADPKPIHDARYIGVIAIELQNLHQANEDLSSAAIQQFLNDFKNAINSSTRKLGIHLEKKWLEEDLLLLTTGFDENDQVRKVSTLANSFNRAIEQKNELRRQQGRLVLKTRIGADYLSRDSDNGDTPATVARRLQEGFGENSGGAPQCGKNLNQYILSQALESEDGSLETAWEEQIKGL